MPEANSIQAKLSKAKQLRAQNWAMHKLTSPGLFSHSCINRITGLNKQTSVHNHNTGTNMDLHIKPCNTNTHKKSVIDMGIWLYNKVPINIKNLEEYKPCKRELKSFLTDHVFYSV
jgi:hypothetical protein